MRNVLFAVLAVLLFSCDKDTDVAPNSMPKTLLKLAFFDEFATMPLDSVTFSVPKENKTYTLTQGKSFIEDLPKGIVEARISKKGFVTQDYKVDFSKRDTINDNIVMQYDDFILDVPQDSLFATKNRKSFSFQVRRNAGFKIDRPDWVRVDTSGSSKFSIKIVVTILPNNTQETRQGEIVFTKGGSRRIIPVTQFRKNSVQTAYAKVNDVVSVELEMADEFIGFPRVERLDEYCLAQVTYQNVEGKQIDFSNGCVSTLRPNLYKIYLNNKGGVDTVDFQVTLYDKKIDLNVYREQMSDISALGSSTHLYYLDKERKNLGVIDRETFTIVKRINLPVTPKKMVYNAFNKSYYVLSNDEYLRVLDMQRNEIVETILIPTDPVNDHPQSPYNIPDRLHFNQDGLGFMVTVGDNISGNGYRVVKSQENNKMEVLVEFPFSNTWDSGVLPNKKDFYFNDAYENAHYTWSASTGKSTKEFGRYRILNYKNWAINDDNRLIDYYTKADLGARLSVYPIFLDKNTERFYGWSSSNQQYFLTQLDAKGNVIARIPGYQNDMLLSDDGKYIYIYDAGNADLYQMSTEVFNGRRKIAVK
ncbi:BACON domain-containing protein [Sphingobacterium bambusae]|nr:BACON domain-containing protein [Sphingobacterium bambusae]WPL47082.1 BACON domain-containing protein [Sphingobacterium bambusae]